MRAVGSTPTIYVDSVEKARNFRQDHAHDRFTVEFTNGGRMEMNSHLYSADELGKLVGADFVMEDVAGLDIFHGRFAPDSRWNPRRSRATTSSKRSFPDSKSDMRMTII